MAPNPHLGVPFFRCLGDVRHGSLIDRCPQGCQQLGSAGHSEDIGTLTELHGDSRSDQIFVRLYERYHDEVHAFCMRRVGPASTDDVVSEVFTVVWRSIDRVDREAERAWVYGVARNVIRNQWRADRRWRNLKEKVFWMHEPSPPQPDALSMAEVKRAEVLEAVRSLTPKDREILMLSGWDDLSGPEIATVLGISVSAAQQRLHRAKKRLANEMSRVLPTADDESEAAS